MGERGGYRICLYFSFRAFRFTRKGYAASVRQQSCQRLRSGFCLERRRSVASEPCRWRRGERYETCIDDGVRGSAPKLCMAYSRARCLPSSPQLRALAPPAPAHRNAGFRRGVGQDEDFLAAEPGASSSTASSTGSIGTMFLIGESSTLSTLRRQMSRSPLLLRKVTEMPLRLRAATLLRI